MQLLFGIDIYEPDCGEKIEIKGSENNPNN